MMTAAVAADPETDAVDVTSMCAKYVVFRFQSHAIKPLTVNGVFTMHNEKYLMAVLCRVV